MQLKVGAPAQVGKRHQQPLRAAALPLVCQKLRSKNSPTVLHGAWVVKPALLEVAAAAGVRPLQLLDEQNARQILLPASELLYEKSKFVDVGTIIGAFGIVGEIRVEISTDNPKQRFRTGSKLYLHPPRPKGLLTQTSPKECPLYQVVVQASKVRILPKGQQVWVLKCREVADRDAAEQLSGFKIVIPITQREQLKDPDEFWVQDLVGCEVSLQSSGEKVGLVVDVISGTGTYDTMVVQLKLTPEDIASSSTRRCMVPFVKVMCPEVDLRERQILISPPEGLLDLVSKKPMGKKLKPEQKEAMLAELKAGRQPSLARARSSPTASTTSAGSRADIKPQAGGSGSGQAASSSGGAAADSRRKASGPKRQDALPANQQGGSWESDRVEDDGDVVEDDGDDVEVTSSDTPWAQQAAANERWRLRRSLGASLASRSRAKRGLRGRRGLSSSERSKSDTD